MGGDIWRQVTWGIVGRWSQVQEGERELRDRGWWVKGVNRRGKKICGCRELSWGERQRLESDVELDKG